MTKQNTAYKADMNEIAEDDPLAELARIVSGETPENANASQAANDQAANVASADLDLEAELMRELGGQTPEEVVAEQPNAPAPVSSEVVVLESSVDQLENELMQALSSESAVVPSAEPMVAEVQSQTDYETVPVTPTEMLSSLEKQLQDDLAVVDQVAKDVAVQSPEVSSEDFSEAAGADLKASLAEAAADAQSVETVSNTDDLDQFLQDAIQNQSDPVIEAPEIQEVAVPIEAMIEEAPAQIQEEFIPQEPVEIEAQIPEAEIAQSAPIDPDLDFGEAFTAEVNEIAAQQETQSVEDLEQGFADAFADELSLDKTELGSAAVPTAAVSDIAHAPIEPSIEPAIDDTIAASNEYPATAATSSGGSGFKMALGALGIALIAGLGVVGWGAINSGSGEGDAVVIKADNEPIKVKPENPGGKVIANTENKVYETVAGSENQTTNQDSLINSTQQPVNIEKSASRLEPTPTSESDSQLGGVSAKRVNTLTIRQDGTIIRNEAPKPVEIARVETTPTTVQSEIIQPETIQPETVVQPVTRSVGTVDGVEVLQPVTNIPENAIILDENSTTITPSTSNQSNIVETIPLATTEPVTNSQPVVNSLPEIIQTQPIVRTQPVQTQATPSRSVAAKPAVDPNAPTQIAALPTQNAAPTNSEWKVQVSSQRSADAAERSYQNLKRRFSSLLSPRSVSIQRAVVQGKGTFFRVKIPANSRADANRLCSRLKSAGGSCFVTR